MKGGKFHQGCSNAANHVPDASLAFAAHMLSCAFHVCALQRDQSRGRSVRTGNSKPWCKRLNGLWAQHLEKCWGKTQVGLTWDSRHEGLGGEMEMCKQQGKQVRRGEGKQAVDSLDSLGKTLEGHSGRVTRVLWMECLL